MSSLEGSQLATLGTQTVRNILRRLAATQAIMVVVVSVAAMSAVALAQHEMGSYRSQVTTLVDSEQALRLSLNQAQSAMRGYVLNGQANDKAVFAERTTTATRLAGDLSRQSQGLVDTTLLQGLQANLSQWVALASDVVASPPGAGAGATAADKTEPADVRKAYTAVMSQLDHVHDKVVAIRDARTKQYETRMWIALLSILAASVVFVALSLYVTGWAGHLLALPLTDLAQVVRRHQRGDRKARADATRGATEVVSVAQAFNQLADTQEVLEADRQQVLDYYRLQARVAGALTADHSADDFVAAVQALGEGMGADRAILHILANDEEMLRLRAAWVRPGTGTMVSDFNNISLQGMQRPILAPRQAVAVNSLSDFDERFPRVLIDRFSAVGWRSGVLMAVYVGSDFLGVLSLVTLYDRIWDPSELRAIERCGDYVGQTIAERRLLESMQEVEAQQADFLATTSHELRTPLTSISGYMEMFDEGDLGELTPSQRSAIGVIQRNVQRLRALIDDLLIMNRLSVAHPMTNSADFDVSDRVRRTVESLAVVAQRSGVDLTLERSDAASIKGDPDQIERAVSNIVSNAVKFTPSGGTVRVSCAVQGDEVVITCVDTGMGIPPQDLPAIFERFSRASNARRNQVPGTGLGLPIVKAIVEAHGGRVQAESRQNQGSTFTIRLPRVRG